MMKAKYLIAAALAACTLGSCSDMLEVESDRNAYDPSLDQKVDSMFYTLGALKALQQATDQYVLTNELRGDLASLTSHASTDLQELFSHNVSATNKYDSAYVYYRIINNCNYYIAHRDTTLSTGSTMVAMAEYGEAHALRAWAYLQLARTYGNVPFYTEPLTDVGGIESVAGQPKKSLEEICSQLAPEMERYADQPVPSWGNFDAGSPWASRISSSTKTVVTSKMMIPLHVILGDLYLETGQYEKAVTHYFAYLKARHLNARNFVASYTNMSEAEMEDLPTTFMSGQTYSNGSISGIWSSNNSGNNNIAQQTGVFAINATNANNTGTSQETVTYVPFSTNKLRGTTTELPRLFGFNFYSTSEGSVFNEELSIVASSAYKELAESQEYYYCTRNRSGKLVGQNTPIGDMRYRACRTNIQSTNADSTYYMMNKFCSANVPIYRASGIYLKLAEAINRLGYPDVAFAVLKDGLNGMLSGETIYGDERDTVYITPEGRQFLTTGLAPFLADENVYYFNGNDNDEVSGTANNGIHGRGCGYTSGNASGYTFEGAVSRKLQQIANKLNVTATGTKADTINAVEDLICDEMALELAFEGSRFSDLCRIARHKNAAGTYSSTFGSQWLANKLAFKNPAVDLSDPNNWYMPFR